MPSRIVVGGKKGRRTAVCKSKPENVAISERQKFLMRVLPLVRRAEGEMLFASSAAMRLDDPEILDIVGRLHLACDEATEKLEEILQRGK